jgi:hypothetical protein
MAPQSYPTECTESFNPYPTSPWTETFRSCMTDAAEQQPAQPADSHRFEQDTQEPTREALSYIYNREH